MEKLRYALATGGFLSSQDIERIISCYQVQHLKAGEDFHTIGKISDRIGFVESGALRVYAHSPQGEDVTIFFIRSNQFIMDIESFYNNKPSKVAIQAVTDTTMYYIQRSEWHLLSDEIPKLYILTKSLTETALLSKINDNDFLNFGAAKVKYQEFVKRYPDLALHVPLQYIASYLKITPQSLSRIRREITGAG